MDYYRVNFPYDENEKVLLEEPHAPSWGCGAYYLDEAEILRAGQGPFAPEKMDMYWDDSTGTIPDFPRVDLTVITVKRSAYDEMAHFFKGISVLYPAFISGVEYVSIKPIHFFDVMDPETSMFRRASSGDLINPKRVWFKKPPPLNIHYFALEFEGRQKPFIFCSGDFKAFCESKNYTGISFKQAWPTEGLS